MKAEAPVPGQAPLELRTRLARGVHRRRRRRQGRSEGAEASEGRRRGRGDVNDRLLLPPRTSRQAGLQRRTADLFGSLRDADQTPGLQE